MPRPGDLLARCRLAGHIFRRAGLTGLRQAFAYARASKTRERNYQIYLREIESGLLAAEAAAPFPAGVSPPHIGILTPLYNTPPTMLHRCIQSVRAQTYDRWTLCLIDDASTHPHVAAIARSYAAIDPRIRFTQLQKNSGISAATNAALAQAVKSGCDYIALLDHDDELSPHALRALARRIAENPELELLYTDEDKIPPPNEPESPVPAPMHAASAPFAPPAHRHTPTFKPGFSPHLLLSHNYICHLLCIRTRHIKEVGGFRSEYDGAQDYDLILRLLLTIPASHIAHLPLILYHWRTHPASTSLSPSAKPWAIDAGRRALTDHLSRLAAAPTVEHHPFRPTFHISVALPPATNRIAAFIHLFVHSRHNSPTPPIATALRSSPFLAQTELFRHPAVLNDDILRLRATHPDFRWLLFIADHLKPASADWLEQLLQTAHLPDAHLIIPRVISSSSGRTLSAGRFFNPVHTTLDLVGFWLPRYDPGYLWRLTAPYNASAFDGSCFLLSLDTAERIARTVAGEFPGSAHQVWGSATVAFRLPYVARRLGLNIVVEPRALLAAPDSILPSIPADDLPPDDLLNPNLRLIESDCVRACKQEGESSVWLRDGETSHS